MSTLKLFFRYIKKDWFRFVLTAILIIILNYIRSFIPSLTSAFVAIVSNKSIEESEVPSIFYVFYQNALTIKDRLLITALLIGIVAIVRETLNIICDVNVCKVSESIGGKVQIAYFKKVQDLSYSYLNHAETGDLIQRSTNDVYRFKTFITGSFLELLNSLCKTVIFGICMIMIDVKFGLIVLSFVPIYLIMSFIYFKKQSKNFEKMEDYEGKMQEVVQENLTDIRIVKAFANEKYETLKYQQVIEKRNVEWVELDKKAAAFWGLSDMLTYFQMLVIFVLSVIFVGNGTVSFDAVVAMFIYTLQIAWPCRNLGRVLADLGKTSICTNRIIEILDKPSEYINDGTLTPEIKGNITFENVSFTFDDASIPTLNNINLEIKAGECIAIVGKTGCGKSTFVNMLAKLVIPTSGNIYFDGINLKDISKKHVRDNVGLMLQEPFLYSKTIKENIEITMSSLNDDAARVLAKKASVDKDIEGFKEKYETMVGERGVTLSGGQRQRIAIARMLASKKPIIIFDDSLSAVDSETDIKIRKALKENQKDTTTLIITSRIVTAKDADKIIVFEDGKISAVGTHKELIKKDGLYKTIYNIQSMYNPGKEN